MTIQDRFLEYADAFEVTYKDDDWSRLAQYFTGEATYDSGDGSMASGLEAVLDKLKAAVDGLDRAMDSRTVTFLQPPTTEGDTVVVNWSARYTKAGLQIGGKLAKFSTSATRISEEIYLKEAVYMYYPSAKVLIRNLGLQKS